MASQDTNTLVDLLFKALPNIDKRIGARIRQLERRSANYREEDEIRNVLQQLVKIFNLNLSVSPVSFLLNYQMRRIFPFKAFLQSKALTHDDIGILANGILQHAEGEFQGPLLSLLYRQFDYVIKGQSSEYETIRLKKTHVAIKAMARYRSVPKRPLELLEAYQRDKKDLGASEANQIYSIFGSSAFFNYEELAGNETLCKHILAATILSEGPVSVSDICALNPNLKPWLNKSYYGFPKLKRRINLDKSELYSNNRIALIQSLLQPRFQHLLDKENNQFVMKPVNRYYHEDFIEKWSRLKEEHQSALYDQSKRLDSNDDLDDRPATAFENFFTNSHSMTIKFAWNLAGQDYSTLYPLLLDVFPNLDKETQSLIIPLKTYYAKDEKVPKIRGALGRQV